MLELIENNPFDVEGLKEVYQTEKELKLSWPSARWPIEEGEWTQWLEAEHSESVSLIFELHQKKIGHIAFKRYLLEPKMCYLCFVYMQPDFRSKGLSKVMLDQALFYAKSRWSLDEVHLLVEKNNLRALQFYEKNGFQVLDTMNDKWRMRKMTES
ncbi:GNAT family N-acetyltransferase [Halobacteriovorax sp. GB3]|uniref:GNAT family N-acetyltransferase n=1 Tax=Halobacteriovorax sp. GB3 TaxID=2719615 RepID=UPI0023611355|nr:GNAT family N-acetyltransferase [Halobacteriovorax sp. GB3]MDD0851901.1 GNAT family N-acetyltransferase [Halobacteriovorax sp. GB3]